jgi:hypothetical protein
MACYAALLAVMVIHIPGAGSVVARHSSSFPGAPSTPGSGAFQRRAVGTGRGRIRTRSWRFRRSVFVTGLDSTTVAAVDSIALLAHGSAFSRIDGLSHFAVRDRLHNGVRADQLAPGGVRKLGVENRRAGIVTRGVIVDVPRLESVPYLGPGTAVTVADLEAWERRHGNRRWCPGFPIRSIYRRSWPWGSR